MPRRRSVPTPGGTKERKESSGIAADIVERARARLNEALADTRPQPTHDAPAHAASYLFALARRAYLEVADTARTGFVPAMEEIERVVADETAIQGMALNPAELAICVRDPIRQLRIFEPLQFSTTELTQIREQRWCTDVAKLIDNRLLVVAEQRRDINLAATLCSSVDEDVASAALRLTGRALSRALAHATKEPVDDPLRATEHIVQRVKNLEQWLGDAQQHADENLTRLVTAIERRANRARERAARAIGFRIDDMVEELYEVPVADVNDWARRRQHVLAAGKLWHDGLADGAVTIEPLVATVELQLGRAAANGVGWAMRSGAAAEDAHIRLRRTVSLLGTGLVAALASVPLLGMAAGDRLSVALPLVGAALAIAAVLAWELRELRDPDAWLTFYRHPAEDAPVSNFTSAIEASPAVIDRLAGAPGSGLRIRPAEG